MRRKGSIRQKSRRVPQIEEMDRSLKGAYILEFRIDEPVRITVGKLGTFRLGTGWYYYVGSARNGLRGRLLRHILGPGKLHWHIDYLTRIQPPERLWLVVTGCCVEPSMAEILGGKCTSAIARFGCSDSPAATTHLFFSGSRRDFLAEMRKLGTADIVLI